MKHGYADWYNRCLGKMGYDAEYVKNFCESCRGIVLEPGCGTGRLVPYVSAPDRRFLEPCPDMTRVFLSNYPEEEPNLLSGSADKIPLPDESVSGIYVPFNGIGELVPIVFAIKEFYRVLKKGGRLLICAANPGFPMLRELIGISRSGEITKSGFQYTIRTMKTAKGKYSWQTTLRIRENIIKRREHQFYIDQYMLPKEILEKVCNEIGFKTEVVHGSYDGADWKEDSPWTLLNMSKKSDRSKIVSGDVQKLISVYDSIAERYDSFAGNGQYIGPSWLRKKLDNMDYLKPNILDLGCANGYLGGEAKARFKNCSLTGVDASPVMIDTVKKRGSYDRAISWDLNVGLPFVEAELFDMVFALGVFEFIKNPECVLEGISEVLELHGTCFASFECFDPARTTEKTVTDPRIGFPRYLRTADEVRLMIKAARMEVVSLEKIKAYKSPSTGEEVDYYMCEIKRDRRI